MRNIKIVIEYDGTKYKGWQRLGDSDNTIQHKIETVLSKMAGENIEITASGRTDAGVHATNQVANFRTESSMSDHKMRSYCYEYLPEDIVVKSVEEVDMNFHARYNAKVKKYVYNICNNKAHNVFNRKYEYHIPQPLNIEKMRKASEYLIGEHDFQSFTTLKTKKKSTVRNIYTINIVNEDGNIEISIQGNGFMKNMVRLIVGTLIEVGLGERPADGINDILDKKERKYSGHIAPAKGLFLDEVNY
ncbi:tRNA pseudouridine(38-40) synthase TruA [Clostridium estertheticum]|uniref:tRNA pseudouridine(38-40) synthase TruA n=1 Tax=Clostridium estertheticum TaxID=238834 RepID=UPI0013E9787C|nr:tRNA pseudouridine(38-40) synthase TruA [Clostridium estertheticum]MBZ9684930.1 tRNA pseudouridine(38-40) synthase TruA [Clostridium estertheticum]